MTLSTEERQALDDITSGSSYGGTVRERAQIVAWYDDGYSVKQVAEMAGTTPPTVRKWVRRFAEEGVDGLVDRPHPGREPWVPERVGAVLWHFLVRLPRPVVLGGTLVVGCRGGLGGGGWGLGRHHSE